MHPSKQHKRKEGVGEGYMTEETMSVMHPSKERAPHEATPARGYGSHGSHHSHNEERRAEGEGHHANVQSSEPCMKREQIKETHHP